MEYNNKFKVGQRVRVITNGYGLHPDAIGQETTIINVIPPKFSIHWQYTIDLRGFHYNGTWVAEPSFEEIESSIDIIQMVDDLDKLIQEKERREFEN